MIKSLTATLGLLLAPLALGGLRALAPATSRTRSDSVQRHMPAGRPSAARVAATGPWAGVPGSGVDRMHDTRGRDGSRAGEHFGKRVLIVQTVAKRYREPLFDLMHSELARQGVKLEVAYSDPSPLEALRGDNTDLRVDYGRKLPARWLLGGRMLYQPIGGLALRADLVIVEQANKYVMNLPLILLARLGIKRVAYWGHGRDRKADARAPSERIKRRLAGWSQWWFPYTDGCARELASAGVAPSRMTVLHNSVDTRAFAREIAGLSSDEMAQFRAAHGLREADRVAVFCGSLYRSKALGLLLLAGQLIAERHPGFRLLILGDGPDRVLLEEATRSTAWLRYLGPTFGREKALAFAASEFVLNPGAVGLALLDAFAAGRTFISAEHKDHGPEVDYLRHGANGLLLEASAPAFAQGVSDLLDQPARLAAMSMAARGDAETFSVEAMARRFSEGILACLANK